MPNAMGPTGASEASDEVRPGSPMQPNVGGGPSTPADMPGGVGPVGAPPVPVASMPTPAATTAPATVATPPVDTSFTPPGPQTVATQEARTQIVGGAKIDPLIQAETHIERFRQSEANAEAARIDAEAAQKTADIERDRAKKIENERLVQENAAEKRRLALDEEMAKVRAAQKDLDAVHDPGKPSVPTRIVNAIMLAMGEFGRALSGGTNNAAMQIIENDRAQRLQAWKAQYARAQGKVTGSQNMYAMMRQKGFDDATAEAATIQKLNEGYDSAIKQVAAASKAPAVLARAEAASAAINQDNLQRDQVLQQNAQARVTRIIDDKSVTKEGGANTEEKTKLVKLANDDEYLKRYRTATSALGRFDDLVKGGADGAALADFIAGKGGLEQGSFGPNFIQLMKKRSIFGQGIEKLREAWNGGVAPDILQSIRGGLAAETGSALVKAKPSIVHFRREFARAGIDPHMVTGGETPQEAAEAVGATPAAYQGAKK